jgi:hypothetical protein
VFKCELNIIIHSLTDMLKCCQEKALGSLYVKPEYLSKFPKFLPAKFEPEIALDFRKGIVFVVSLNAGIAQFALR